jgi:hypothetical protein
VEETRALRILNQIMDWDEERAQKEFAWLRMMARVKYDGYRDFLAGMRFLESLAAWLQQFDQADRETAYDLLRRRLIYVGPAEMQRLVELFYPTTLERHLIDVIARRRKVAYYRVLADPGLRKELDVLRGRTLIMGLSDGARIDILRHSNVGILTNEQFVVQTQLDESKWADLLNDLRKESGADATFEVIYLVDDFMGSGTTFLRWDRAKNSWTGKLVRFLKSLEANGRATVSDQWELCIHHYLASERAQEELPARIETARGELKVDRLPKITFGAAIPRDYCVLTSRPEDAKLVDLTQRYYNAGIETDATRKGEVNHLGLGYAGIALPLVLDHNTPNNSLAILWAEIDAGMVASKPYPEMRPLFRRRQRHTT